MEPLSIATFLSKSSSQMILIFFGIMLVISTRLQQISNIKFSDKNKAISVAAGIVIIFFGLMSNSSFAKKHFPLSVNGNSLLLDSEELRKDRTVLTEIKAKLTEGYVVGIDGKKIKNGRVNLECQLSAITEFKKKNLYQRKEIKNDYCFIEISSDDIYINETIQNPASNSIIEYEFSNGFWDKKIIKKQDNITESELLECAYPYVYDSLPDKSLNVGDSWGKSGVELSKMMSNVCNYQKADGYINYKLISVEDYSKYKVANIYSSGKIGGQLQKKNEKKDIVANVSLRFNGNNEFSLENYVNNRWLYEGLIEINYVIGKDGDNKNILLIGYIEMFGEDKLEN